MTAVTITASELVPAELSSRARADLRRRAEHEFRFGVLDIGAGAYFDDARSAAVFAERYRALATRSGSVQPTYAVCDDAGRPHVWSGDGPAYVWPYQPLSPAAVAFFADAFATHELLSTIPFAVSLHAASLHRNGVAFALTGLSTAGKSTTALACAAAGAQLYSDERCITTPSGTIPFPRAMSVRADGKRLLLDTLPECELRRRLASHTGTDWKSAGFDELFGDQLLPQPAPLRVLFAIVGRDAVARSRRIAPAAMLALAEPAAKTWARGLDRVAALFELCRSVDCYELVLGNPVDSARHVLSVVDAVAA
jgi:hypothetical protein